MNPPAITITDWKPRESGTLRGFFTAHLASGLVLHELTLHERDGKWWISFPSKPMLGAEGVALRDDSEKVRYSVTLSGSRIGVASESPLTPSGAAVPARSAIRLRWRSSVTHTRSPCTATGLAASRSLPTFLPGLV
jgi:hypothetical protein